MADAKITVSFDQDSRRAIQKFLRQIEELIVRIEALKPAEVAEELEGPLDYYPETRLAKIYHCFEESGVTGSFVKQAVIDELWQAGLIITERSSGGVLPEEAGN